jgi:hypothetical protein
VPAQKSAGRYETNGGIALGYVVVSSSRSRRTLSMNRVVRDEDGTRRRKTEQETKLESFQFVRDRRSPLFLLPSFRLTSRFGRAPRAGGLLTAKL